MSVLTLFRITQICKNVQFLVVFLYFWSEQLSQAQDMLAIGRTSGCLRANADHSYTTAPLYQSAFAWQELYA